MMFRRPVSGRSTLRTGLAALAAGLLAAGPSLAPLAASAQTVDTKPVTRVSPEVTKDKVTTDFPDSAFAEEREISRIVQEVYGEGADKSSGRRTSEDITQALKVGEPLPERAGAKPVEDKLASRLPAGSDWMAVGENLVALDAGGKVTRVYHDMLP